MIQERRLCCNTRPSPFDFIQEATREHRRRHGCSAYTFEDGAGLIALAQASDTQPGFASDPGFPPR
jgi:hypothetical protein